MELTLLAFRRHSLSFLFTHRFYNCAIYLTCLRYLQRPPRVNPYNTFAGLLCNHHPFAALVYIYCLLAEYLLRRLSPLVFLSLATNIVHIPSRFNAILLISLC